MRQALRVANPARTRTSVVKTVPAPTGGWNARDSLADMPMRDAVALDNFFPKPTYCEIRGGYANHVTGMTGGGKTLAVYNALSGTNKMFAATATQVYDASSAGAVGAAVATITDGKFQYVNYGDGGTQYLIMVNGVDKALYYNGTTWTSVDSGTSPALIGLATTSIIHVNVFKERLFFIQKASLSFWYLPAGSVGGTLAEYPMDGFFKKGGYLMAMGTWTLDSGSGVDDYAVFVTSEGEAAVFSGTNPASSTFWQLVGVYQIPKPLGRRCFTKFGGDMVILTESGAFPLSAALQSSTIDSKLALSFKIENAFTDSARLYGSNFGWEVQSYPAQSALVVNVPIAVDGMHYQYVMNTITKSWCRFIGWDAEAFAVYNGELYFTTSNKVVKAWTGKIDGTANIETYGKQAFTDFGDESLKQFGMFEPVLAVNGNLEFLTDIDVDYRDTAITGSATYTVTTGGQWDVSNWDEGYWAGGLEIIQQWKSPDENLGYCAAGKIKVATNYLDVQWVATRFNYTRAIGI